MFAHRSGSYIWLRPLGRFMRYLGVFCFLSLIALGCVSSKSTKELKSEVSKEEARLKKEAMEKELAAIEQQKFTEVPRFMKLSCKSCHMGMKYEYLGLEDKKVGPSLKNIASKVNPSWLFRWVKKPGNYRKITRMPCFGFTDNDALADTAFTMNQSNKNYQFSQKFTPASNPAKGRILFEKIGCRGCHEINGKGGNFAPNLSKVANKINPDWVYNWLLNPAQYDTQTIMPVFRLSKSEAREIVTYLMTLGKREDIEGINEKIKSPRLIAQGEKIIIRKGCYGCHRMNLAHNIVPNTPPPKTLRVRKLLEKEFGVYKVSNILKDLAIAQSKGDSLNNARVKLVSTELPTNGFDIFDERDNLFNEYRHNSERAIYIKEGLRLIKKYNCRGCHTIGGEGGKLAPVLDYEGERVQTKYLFDFLINPRRIRPATLFSARMPTFNFTQEEVVKLVIFFKAFSDVSLADQSTVDEILSDNYLIEMRKAAPAIQCEECEDINWLKNTQLYPGGLMPDYISVEGEDKHVTNGRRLFLYYCAQCHGYKGKGDGFNAVNLDPQPRGLTDKKEVYMAKQKNEHLFNVISNGGKSIEKSPRMPPFGKTLSEKERWEIIAFVRTLHSYKDEAIDFEEANFDAKRPKTVVKKISSDKFQKVNRRGTLIGKSLFKKLGCTSCHKIGDQGGKVGPELTHVGSRLNGPWIFRFIKNPQRIMKNVKMPNFGLSDDNALKLTHYLLSLK